MNYLSKEFLVVRFPIYLPIIYFLILNLFPSLEIYLLTFTLLFLAEPHFAATWPIFFNKINYPYIYHKKAQLLYGTIFVLLFSIIGFFTFKNTFLLIFFAANLFHVTRQSVGVLKLYYKSQALNQMINISYIFAITYFLIGLMRFYFPVIKNENLLATNLIILSVICLSLIYFKIKEADNKDILTFFSGIIIFYPICFVDKPIHAITMGVTMHYSQYLYFTYLIDKGRKLIFSKNLIFNYKFVLFILIYGIIMTMIVYLGKNESIFLKSLIIIPITGQMLHFYIDSFIWRFSEKHNREVTLKYIKI